MAQLDDIRLAKWVERIERTIETLFKSNAIPFPSTDDFRRFKYLLLMRLKGLGIDFMILNDKLTIIQTLTAEIDPPDGINPPNIPYPPQVAIINRTALKLDAAVLNLIIISLPTQLIVENDSYINFSDDATRDPLHTAAFAVFQQLQHQLTHQIEAEKCEFINTLGAAKSPKESMQAYIGKKIQAKHMLNEKFHDPISDAMCRTYLISGLSGDSTMKTIMDQLLHHQPPTLRDTISFLEISAREKEKAAQIQSRMGQNADNQAFSMFDALPPRNLQLQPPTKAAQSSNRRPQTKKETTSSSSSTALRFCYNHALQLNCAKDPCPFVHLPPQQVATTKCPFRKCRKSNSNQCPFQHAHASSSSAINNALVADDNTTDATCSDF